MDDNDIEPTEEFMGQLTTNDSARIPDDKVPITIIDDDGKMHLSRHCIILLHL